MSVIQILRNVLAYSLVTLMVIVAVIPVACIVVFAPQRYMHKRGIVFTSLDLIYRGATLALLLPRRWHDTDRIPQEPAIIVANHQSSIDIPVVGAVLNGAPHLWYALAYYARHPLWGFFLRRLGISVDLERSGTSAKSLLKGVKLLENDSRHAIVFPEGGRYPGKDVREFYRGFAMLARQTGRPVVPVYMPHNGKIFPPDAYLTRWHPLVAQVGESFYLQEGESDHDFVARVRQWFIQESQKWT